MENKDIERALDEEILNATKSLKDLGLGSKEYSEATEAVCKLMKAKTEQYKAEKEVENQYYDAEIRQQQVENEEERHKEDLELQKKQAKRNLCCKFAEIAVAVGTFVVGVVVTMASQNKAYLFEEKGTIASKTAQDAVRNGTQFLFRKH